MTYLRVLPFAAILLSAVYLLWRNWKVYKYRRNLIKKTGELDRADINRGMPYTGWRFKKFNEVTYDEMLLSFRSLGSFYKDTSFLK